MGKIAEYLRLVETTDESLAEHDERFHPDGYREGDSCELRNGMAKSDKSDSLYGFYPDISKKEDEEYKAAVEAGDMGKAAELVLSAASRYKGNLIEKDGKPAEIEISDKGLNPINNPWNVPSMPDELAAEIASWGTISKSPYSDSFYDAEGITWTHKPDGSLRVADHWNFYSGGQEHCTTDKPVDNVKQWTVARYSENDGKYHVMKKYDALGEYVHDDFERFPKMVVGGKKQARKIHDGMVEAMEMNDKRNAEALIGRKIKEYQGFSNVLVKGKNKFGDYTLVREDGKTITAKARNISAFGPPPRVFIDYKTGMVKSADPVTYDDKGNFIPLSKRFDDGDDIRGKVK